MCSWEGLLDFESEGYAAFCLLSGQGSALLSIVLLLMFWSFCPQGRTPGAYPEAYLSPASARSPPPPPPPYPARLGREEVKLMGTCCVRLE